MQIGSVPINGFKPLRTERIQRAQSLLGKKQQLMPTYKFKLKTTALKLLSLATGKTFIDPEVKLARQQKNLMATSSEKTKVFIG